MDGSLALPAEFVFATATKPLVDAMRPTVALQDATSPESAAFAAILASMGHATVQNGKPQGLDQAAITRLQTEQNGNGLPQLGGEFVPHGLYPEAPLLAGSPVLADPNGKVVRDEAMATTSLPAQLVVEKGIGHRGPFDSERDRGVGLDTHGDRRQLIDPFTGLNQLTRPTPLIPQQILARTDVMLSADLAPTVSQADLPSSSASHTGSVLGNLDNPTSQHATGAREISTPLNHPKFADGLVRQVAISLRDGVHQAHIKIHPAELGPLELRVVVHNDETAIQLASQHAAVRDILEEALPRLREQLEQSGLRLSDSGVFTDLPHNETADDADSTHYGDRHGVDANPEDATDSPLSTHVGFIDAYI